MDLLHGGTSQGPLSRWHHKTTGMRALKPSINSTNTQEDESFQISTLSSLNSPNQYKERRRKVGESQKEIIRLKNKHGMDESCTLIRLGV